MYIIQGKSLLEIHEYFSNSIFDDSVYSNFNISSMISNYIFVKIQNTNLKKYFNSLNLFRLLDL